MKTDMTLLEKDGAPTIAELKAFFRVPSGTKRTYLCFKTSIQYFISAIFSSFAISYQSAPLHTVAN